jgi:hypothetical protein
MYIFPVDAMSKDPVKSFLRRILKNVLPSLFATLAALSLLQMENDLLSLITVISTILVFVIFRLDYRVPIGFGIALLLSAMFFLNDTSISNKIGILSFWLLVTGVSSVLLRQYSFIEKSLTYMTLKRVLKFKNEGCF